MSTPDVTPAQIASWLTAIVAACAVLFKLNLDPQTQALVVGGLAAIVAIGWQVGDAIIRHGRSGNAAAQANLAAAQIANLPPDVGDAKAA